MTRTAKKKVTIAGGASAKRRSPAARAEKAEAPAEQARPAEEPRADGAIVEELRAICMSFPDANERISHGEPTWFAGKGRSFAMLDNHHHGSAHLAVWLPQPFGVQEALIASDPERFFRPPYVGVSGWVGVVLDTGPDWKLVAELVREAYLHVAGAKLKARLLSG